MRSRRLYRWPGHAAWLAALAAQGWQEGTPPGVDLLVTGAAYGPSSDPETAGRAMPGWQSPGSSWATHRPPGRLCASPTRQRAS